MCSEFRFLTVFGMTGGRGGCVALRVTGEKGAVFGMTGGGPRNDRIGGVRKAEWGSGSRQDRVALGMAEIGPCRFE